MLETFRLFHPISQLDITRRNALLTAALRPEPLPFSIESEYPIVLNAQQNTLSFCYGDSEQIAGHANLWQRTIIDRHGQEKARIGLIGNVATAEHWQGQGIMKIIFHELKNKAQELQLDALILWSDLERFYQKLGFQSHGEEYRFIFKNKGKLSRRKPEGPCTLFSPFGPSAKETFLTSIMQLRPPLPLTLERSPSAFRQLLTIPALSAMAGYHADTLQSFFCLGKGYDMMGVIHEWGAESLESLLECINTVLANSDFDTIMLLAPASLTPDWLESLSALADDQQTSPMALLWSNPAAESACDLSPLFIWGLDSI